MQTAFRIEACVVESTSYIDNCYTEVISTHINYANNF